MTMKQLAARVDQLIGANASVRKDAASRLILLRETEPTRFEAVIYEPIVCLILQGEKETTVGDQTMTVAEGTCIVVSHDLPVLARITRASKKTPYLALVIQLDLGVLRSLYDEVGEASQPTNSARSMEIAPVDESTKRVVERYLDLIDDPVEARVLLPLVRKELHFRLFMAESGGMLRSLLHRNSHASSVARAIKHLRENFHEALDVAHLAKSVGMSPSSFHKHFKSVTMTTPLQYQKDLRLTQARQLLRAGRCSASTAAFEVGYESPSQFSREYSRKFGKSPRADLRPELRVELTGT